MVPHCAMSGGTLIALAADEIGMEPNAVPGLLDPQLATSGAHACRRPPSILRAIDAKGRDEAQDQTLMLADVAEKALNQVQEARRASWGTGWARGARRMAEELVSGRYTQGYPITVRKLRGWGSASPRTCRPRSRSHGAPPAGQCEQARHRVPALPLGAQDLRGGPGEAVTPLSIPLDKHVI
ncbi:MAG: SDH family Clp fold serine proteinase [Conexivisphaera sp.]